MQEYYKIFPPLLWDKKSPLIPSFKTIKIELIIKEKKKPWTACFLIFQCDTEVTSERGSGSELERWWAILRCCWPLCTRLSLNVTHLVGQLLPRAEMLRSSLHAPEGLQEQLCWRWDAGISHCWLCPTDLCQVTSFWGLCSEFSSDPGKCQVAEVRICRGRLSRVLVDMRFSLGNSANNRKKWCDVVLSLVPDSKV